ncbi:uncharacterized protein LOC144508024 [Mustelus asterias]
MSAPQTPTQQLGAEVPRDAGVTANALDCNHNAFHKLPHAPTTRPSCLTLTAILPLRPTTFLMGPSGRSTSAALNGDLRMCREGVGISQSRQVVAGQITLESGGKADVVAHKQRQQQLPGRGQAWQCALILMEKTVLVTLVWPCQGSKQRTTAACSCLIYLLTSHFLPSCDLQTADGLTTPSLVTLYSFM